MPESQRFIKARLALSLDEARLLPRFRTPTWTTPAPLIETDAPRDWRPASATVATFTAQELRGIPVIGRSVAGAIPGTNPLTELLRKDTAA